MIAIEDDFGVGVAFKVIAKLAEFRTQLYKVVNFAVEDYLKTAIFIGHWLMPCSGQVND